MPIVKDELNKFNTERYKELLETAKVTVSKGEVCLYDDWTLDLSRAKALPKATKEQKEIRADAIKLSREKKRSYKLLMKYGKENLILPDEKRAEEIRNREYNTEKERREIKKELKAYTKGVSVYRRITKPYNDARNLVIQAENYTHLDEIERLYESIVADV